MIDDKTYELNELQRLGKQLSDVESASLADRKASAAVWYDAMSQTPETVVERINWMLDGSYGFGAYVMAVRIATGGKRLNKAWRLGTLIAMLEWSCPAQMAVKQYKRLPVDKQEALNVAIVKMIEEWQEEK
jgi:hypothetical protein